MPGNYMRNFKMNSWTTITRTAAIFITILLLTACGGGGGGESGGGGAGGTGTSEPGNGGGSAKSSYGTATLSWLPPTEKTDGSALTLTGYKIYYGTEVGNYTTVINIDNPGLATYVIDNLPAGNTYYFVITAIDADGIESSYSTVGSKTISA